MIVKQDEFEKHARAILRDNPGQADQLMVLRKEIQKEGKDAWSR